MSHCTLEEGWFCEDAEFNGNIRVAKKKGINILVGSTLFERDYDEDGRMVSIIANGVRISRDEWSKEIEASKAECSETSCAYNSGYEGGLDG